MNRPKLACCNFIPETDQLREFALDHGFEGIDWTFTLENLPRNPAEESALVKTISKLNPLETLYHCAFKRVDLGDLDPEGAKYAIDVFHRVCRLVSKLQGRFLTLHVGLGRDTTIDLLWDETIERLAQVVRFANEMGVRLCLENLAWGWTSRPELFEKLIRKSGCSVTIDIGHARVSPSVVSQQYRVKDFVVPHAERVLNAHVYHEENEEHHMPPERVIDLEDRLCMLAELPRCDWWVLELREEQPLLKSLSIVSEFFQQQTSGNEDYTKDGCGALLGKWIL
jgi:sugar phosphate isomerase/epimerase